MIYNIVINSNSKIAGSNRSNYTYNFDWSILQEGEYILTYCFTAEGSAVHDLLTLEVDNLGLTNYTTSSNTSSKTTNIIGFLTPQLKDVGSTHYFVSSDFNPPIYLNSKPRNNQFSIYIKNTSGTLTDLNVDYVLTLSFKKI